MQDEDGSFIGPTADLSMALSYEDIVAIVRALERVSLDTITLPLWIDKEAEG